MTLLQEALKQRDAAKVTYLREYLQVGGGRTRNLVAYGIAETAEYVRPEQRLSVGVAFGDKNSLGLALRVPKMEGIAYRAAKELAEGAKANGSWADLRIVADLAVPARGEVNAIPSLAKAASNDTPLRLGASVGIAKAPAGSLGGFVTIKGKGGGEGIISACHVIANGGRGVDVNDSKKVPMVYHPANVDVPGRVTGRQQIGTLHNFVPLDTFPLEVDAAVAVLQAGRDHTGNVIPDIPGAKNIGKRVAGPPDAESVAQFKTVAKIGRATDYREGRLSAGFFNDVALDVPGEGTVYYDRMFEIESSDADDPFAMAGDSGACVFDVRTCAAFGLVVGGGIWDDNGVSRRLVYACSLESALTALEAEWL